MEGHQRRSHGLRRQRHERIRQVGVMSQAMVAALDADAALAAARAGLAHRLPLADSIVYAAARRAGATVWTHDAHFRDLPGVRFVAAP